MQFVAIENSKNLSDFDKGNTEDYTSLLPSDSMNADGKIRKYFRAWEREWNKDWNESEN